MTGELHAVVIGELLAEDSELTVTELCRVCGLPADELQALIDEGIVDPIGPDAAQWRFRGATVRRVRCAVQLRRDLGVNWAGAALALELLEELQQLRERLHGL